MPVKTECLIEGFYKQFPDERSCIEALSKAKWPSGFRCPRCQCAHAYVTRTRRLPLYQCFQCRHQTTPIAGTVMEGSRTDLRKWLLACCMIANHPDGINARRLSALISVTYKTAWLILAKIRTALSQQDHNTLLQGIVCANVAEAGPPDVMQLRSGKHRRYPLFVAGEYESASHKAPSGSYYLSDPIRLKIKLLPPSVWHDGRVSSFAARDTFATMHVDEATTTHDLHFSMHRYGPKRYMPLVRAAYEASRWIYSSFCGVSSKHLQIYLDEFSFRYNERLLAVNNNSIHAPHNDIDSFTRLLHISAHTIRRTYKQITRTNALTAVYVPYARRSAA